MNKKINYLIFFLLFTVVSHCSFDNKTGIWDEGLEEKERISKLEKEQEQEQDQEGNYVKIYSSEEVIYEEILSKQNITLSRPIKNVKWQMSNFNLHNALPNYYLSSINNTFLKKKIGKDKFSISNVVSSPLIYEDKIIFADDSGTIFYVSKSGKVIWKKNIYKKIYKKIYKNLSFTIYKNKVYVVDNIGFIYVINLRSGEVEWFKNHGTPFKSNIKIFEDNIYVINQDNRILCFSIENGNKIWDLRSISSFIKSQGLQSLAISKEGDLIALNTSGDLFKIKANNGSVLWSLNITASKLAHETDFFRSSSIVLSDDDIIFSASKSLFSYNKANGFLNWKKNIDSNNTPIVDGNHIFVVTNNGFFINLDKTTGEIIWSTNIMKILKNNKRFTKISGFILGSGKLYTLTHNGYLIVSSATSGKTEYFKKIGNEISVPPIVSNGALYILTNKSKIFGFN
ncbi:PQQ-binding-like beta-propeller repeat protein [Pelagibacteraceae bacterium]|nr:PQQ-binding-like beta-propeller repeat protein [Pelagibacteraceae bacterium]